jgi:hypothetical protein
MYARIAEFQSSSKVNCDMLVAFIQNVMIPRNIKNGQLSCEIYRVSETTGFVISSFKNKNDANKIMKIMSEELNEVKGNTRIKLLEGERVFRIDQ